MSSSVGTAVITATPAAATEALLTAPGSSVTGLTMSLGSSSLAHGTSIVSSILSSAVAAATPATTAQAGTKPNTSLAQGEEDAMEAESTRFSHWLFLSLSAVAVIVIGFRLIILVQAHVRHLVCLNDDTQKYWALPTTPFISKLKKNFLLAPLFGMRHNNHFKIGSVGGAGIVPTRFQAIFLTLLLGGNLALTVSSVHWSAPRATILSEIRNRSGVLAVTNMVPLFVLTGRNNPLIPMLKISFDTYNLIHRWLGRIVVMEAVAHTVAHIMNKGWSNFLVSVGKSEFIMVGTISTCAMVVIFLISPSIIRHAFYETFLTLHILLAVASVVGLYYHLALIDNKWLLYLQIAIGLWIAERAARLASIVYRNLGRTMTRATITAISNEACSIKLDMPRPFKFRPGQHVYLYLPSVTGYQSHPFTVAWGEETAPLVWEEKNDTLPTNRQDIYGTNKTIVELIVRRRTGATNQIWHKAAKEPEGTVTVRALVEGPYGTHHSLRSYGTVVMFAGGVGITHQLANVKELVQGHLDGTVAARKVVLVWVIQNPEHLQWVKRQMTSILAIEKRRDVLKVILFVSRPRQSREILSPSSTVQMFPGKPVIAQVLEAEIKERIGTVAVTVCGPGGMSDDVRNAVRSHVDRVNIDFIEESFSW